MKKILFALLISIFLIPSVNAEVNNNNYIIKLLNRDGEDFPFTTWYTVGENTTYSGSNYVQFGYSEVDSDETLPRYLYTVYCGTTNIDLYTTSSNKGVVSNHGSVKGGSCQVIHNGNYYNGNYYLNRWLVDYAFYENEFGVDVYGVNWDIRIHNTSSSNYYVRFETIFLSNEMINDFSSDYLLHEIINQNSTLRQELNSIQSSSEETNSKLDETNEELGNINSNITDSTDKITDSITSTDGPTNIGALDNSAGWLPAGPVDSILNLPLSLLNSLLTAVSSTCQPLKITFPFVDFSYELPCISSIYARISGLNAIIDLIGYTVGVLILYYYFKHLYNWIDNKITMQNDNDWGGI